MLFIKKYRSALLIENLKNLYKNRLCSIIGLRLLIVIFFFLIPLGFIIYNEYVSDIELHKKSNIQLENALNQLQKISEDSIKNISPFIREDIESAIINDQKMIIETLFGNRSNSIQQVRVINSEGEVFGILGKVKTIDKYKYKKIFQKTQTMNSKTYSFVDNNILYLATPIYKPEVGGSHYLQLIGIDINKFVEGLMLREPILHEINIIENKFGEINNLININFKLNNKKFYQFIKYKILTYFLITFLSLILINKLYLFYKNTMKKRDEKIITLIKSINGYKKITQKYLEELKNVNDLHYELSKFLLDSKATENILSQSEEINLLKQINNTSFRENYFQYEKWKCSSFNIYETILNCINAHYEEIEKAEVRFEINPPMHEIQISNHETLFLTLLNKILATSIERAPPGDIIKITVEIDNKHPMNREISIKIEDSGYHYSERLDFLGSNKGSIVFGLMDLTWTDAESLANFLGFKLFHTYENRKNMVFLKTITVNDKASKDSPSTENDKISREISYSSNVIPFRK